MPYNELTRLEQGYVSIYGPQYDAIAPEVVRAFEERQHLLPYVFLFEFCLFAVMLLLQGGRKGPKRKENSEMVKVHSLFQRIVLLGNILIMIYLFITGFSITFGNITGGGNLGYFLRQTHEVAGLFWIPMWLLVTVIAFKDHKHFTRPSAAWGKFFLKGLYTHGQRINYLAFVAFGFILCFSGFWIWFLSPGDFLHAEVIQYKRLILFGHFMGSAVITFFIGETIYSYVVAIRGYLPGLISGKYPKEYLEEFHPEVLDGV
ncbi:MAG: formate dehydrogenase [Arcobacter sp.]|nr:MAG: formate dehydrogenase [Arcobacter sp.]